MGWIFPDEREWVDDPTPLEERPTWKLLVQQATRKLGHDYVPYQSPNERGTEMANKTNATQPALIDVPVTAPAKPAATTTTKKATTKKKETNNMSEKPAAKKTVAEIRAEYEHTISVIRKIYGDAMPIDDPVNPITGRPLNKETDQRTNLRYLAADLGWTSNEFATVAQIKSYGGVVRDGAYKALQFMPGRFYYVVNFDDVEWPNGRPEFTAENKVVTPKKGTTKKTTSRKTTAPKPDPKVKELESEVSDLKAMMAQMMAQNSALIAALTKTA